MWLLVVNNGRCGDSTNASAVPTQGLGCELGEPNAVPCRGAVQA